jgi:hypothetical protein
MYRRSISPLLIALISLLSLAAGCGPFSGPSNGGDLTAVR